MKNPIIDNRIVSSMHFAIRFKRFVESVTVADACSEDEKEAMLNTANALLQYQLKTVDPNNKEEVDYLSRLGLYPIQPLFRTEDGQDVFESEKGTLVYCVLKNPSATGDILKQSIRNKFDFEKINPKRLLFIDKQSAESYQALNVKTYSIQDLKDLQVYDIVEGMKNKAIKLS